MVTFRPAAVSVSPSSNQARFLGWLREFLNAHEFSYVRHALEAFPNPRKCRDAIPRDLEGLSWRIQASQRHLSQYSPGSPKVENVAQSVAGIVRGSVRRGIDRVPEVRWTREDVAQGARSLTNA